MKPDLYVVKGTPVFREQLDGIAQSVKDGSVRACAIVSIEGDDIFTDYATAHGTSLCELLGAVEILRAKIASQLAAL